MIKATETEIKPLWKRWFCIHNFTGGVRVIYDSKGKKRHARICIKCGKRDYAD